MEKRAERSQIDATVKETLGEEEILFSLPFDLDLSVADKKNRQVAILTKDNFYLFSESGLERKEDLGNLASFSAHSGVGTVFAEYQKDGEPVLFARSDATGKSAFVRFAKTANRLIRRKNRKDDDAEIAGKPFLTDGKKEHSRKKNLLRLLMLSKGEWKYLFAGAFLFLITTLISLLVPYLNRFMVDSYILDPEGYQSEGTVFLAGFLGVVASMFGANLLGRLVSILRGYFLTIAGNRLIVKLRNQVFSKIEDLSIAKVSKRTAGELLQRVNHDTSHIKDFLINQLPSLVEQLLLLLAISVVLFLYDWKLALLILIPAPFVAVMFRLFWNFMRGMFHKRWELKSRGSAVLNDIFSGIRVVKSYGMEKREEERFDAVSREERDAEIKQEKVWAVLMPLLNFLMGFGEFIILFYVGRQMLDGVMTAGEMSQFSSYASMVYAPLRILVNFPRHLMNTMTSVSQVYDIIDEEIDVKDGQKELPEDFSGRIDLDSVSYGYETTDEVLHEVDLHINPGEFIGLVGRSGVGKSTLINLIMRMYDPDDGCVRLDGIDARELSQKSIHEKIGVVLQDTFLFTGSVWNNLIYGKPDATREEVIHAAKLAGAHDFIVSLPDGYNTYIGEKGHTLSGGERQRISIARALLQDPKILILDEATSSLDTETEKLIQDALASLCKGRTTVAIAHRLSTLRNATRLVVLSEGRVAETGTHDELMEKEGLYYDLVMAQREMTKI